MKDFNFNESFDEQDENGVYNDSQSEKKKIIKFLIIVVVAAIAGFAVYFVTDALINGNRKTTVVEEKKDSEMDLGDEMIVYLYNNVKYEVGGIRSDKFFKSGSVSVDDFTTQEKMYFALRYATQSDFVNMTSSSTNTDNDTDDDTANNDEEDTTGENTEKQLPTFSISKSKIDEYMFNFFGEGVTYSTDTPFNITVNFAVNGYNSGVMSYDAMSDSFLIKFDSIGASSSDMAINPYLYKIESAMREGKTDNIIIKEKVVFTNCKQYTDESGSLIDKYDCGIYRDYAKTNLIEQKNGVVKSQLSVLGIENYKDNASTVTYTFSKDENDEYHFVSSMIE